MKRINAFDFSFQMYKNMIPYILLYKMVQHTFTNEQQLPHIFVCVCVCPVISWWPVQCVPSLPLTQCVLGWADSEYDSGW